MFIYETMGKPAPWRPPTDVYETSERVVIKVEIAGMSPEDFQISFSDRILQIRGTRRDRQRKRSYHCLEIQYGDFLSEVYLPGHYDDASVDAQYENGFLTITLPKLLPEGPRTITVREEQ
jgi:HSP20 family molecular chaperone IbpA